ncbi:MAG: ABC transporter ATP-binding protein [Candidatus Nitrospinota bacterium M3_3B_026]
MSEPLIKVENLQVFFDTPAGVSRAVDGVSYEARAGKTLGIVGESGCGKTISALSILRLIQPPGRIAGGRVLFGGKDLLTLPEERLRRIRGNRIAMIFQEPMSALNPVFTIGDQVSEPLRVHRGISRREARVQAAELLKKVGIPAPEQRAAEYPHQLSGGMRQRAMIAMALACGPELLIADEPTTALDVTIQQQILDLMLEMKQQYNASIILITHNLGVVAETCQDVVVMYAGTVAEEAEVKRLFAAPAHPYTQGLIESLPVRHGFNEKGRLKEIPGAVPDPLHKPPGCAFHPRCPKVMEICREKTPELKTVDGGTRVACWLY